MTFLEAIGLSLIAFGPCISMFVTTISKDPIRIIILISAGFFWLLSILVSSFIWSILNLFGGYLSIGIFNSIIIQELFRYLLYKLIRNAEKGLQKVSEIGNQGNVIETNRDVLSYVCGLGYGVMSGAFSLFNILADSIGPGTLGINGTNDSNYFFISSSFLTLAFILLNISWSVIFFKGCDQKNFTLVFHVVFSHLVATSITFLNGFYPYILSICLIYLLVCFTGIVALHVSGCSMRTFKLALTH